MTHEWLVDLGSFYVFADDEDGATREALRFITTGDVEIDRIIDEGEIESNDHN
jgi:hypothetical protein